LALPKLLLVDDDETVLTGLTGILEAHGFEVTTAGNALEALKHILSENFDVLLSDLHMPGAADGLTVVSAMRHVHPQAVTILLSANPDMSKAADAILKQADEVLLKPVKTGVIVQLIRQRLAHEQTTARVQTMEPAAAVLERERAAVMEAWLHRMAASGGLKAVPITAAEQTEFLPDALGEIVYRLRYPQALGSMTLFSMAALQHGARRRRQGFRSPVLVEEARALQVAVFEAIERNVERIDLGQLPATLTAIADEVNAQLLQSLSGYENEKPVEFAEDDR
jgi:CheY-like chemotaxis protein